jgi:hypothetical protein
MVAENKSHIWLSHIASVVIVKQQDGDKKSQKRLRAVFWTGLKAYEKKIARS